MNSLRKPAGVVPSVGQLRNSPHQTTVTNFKEES